MEIKRKIEDREIIRDIYFFKEDNISFKEILKYFSEIIDKKESKIDGDLLRVDISMEYIGVLVGEDENNNYFKVIVEYKDIEK